MRIIVFCSYPCSNCPSLSRQSMGSRQLSPLIRLSLSVCLSSPLPYPPLLSSHRDVIAPLETVQSLPRLSASPPLGSTSSLCRSEERPYLDRVREKRARLTYSSLPSLVEPSAEVFRCTLSHGHVFPLSAGTLSILNLTLSDRTP